MQRRSRWRTMAAAAAAAVVASAALVGPADPSGATGAAGSAAGVGGLFRADAAAEGMRVGVSAVGAPVTSDVVDGASPIARAAVDSTSGSSALASVAYPGDIVVTTPGLLAGFSGGQTSPVVPAYPLIAAAGSTTVPESHADGPGATMRAAAGSRNAAASARAGPAPDGNADGDHPSAATTVTSSGVAVADDDTVVATASSVVVGLEIGPLVIGRVVARSTVRRAPGGEPVRQSTFEATGLEVGDTALALTPAGLVVAGTTTPLSASPLEPLLAVAGVSLETVAEEVTDDGVTSAGIVVSRRQDVPATISPVTVHYTFGRATAAVAAMPAPLPAVASAPVPPADGGPAALQRPGPVAGPDAGPAADTDTDSQSAPATAGRFATPAPLGGVGVPAAAPAATTPAGAADTVPAAARPPTATSAPAVPVRRIGARLFDLSGFYLLLVAAAGAAAAVLQFVRHSGVRTRWISRPG